MKTIVKVVMSDMSFQDTIARDMSGLTLLSYRVVTLHGSRHYSTQVVYTNFISTEQILVTDQRRHCFISSRWGLLLEVSLTHDDRILDRVLGFFLFRLS
jgi:hypothetical protein